GTGDDPTGVESLAASAGQAHPRLRIDPVVLGTVGAQLPREVRCREGRGLPGAQTGDVVRRGAPDAFSHLLDEARAASTVHEPLWAYRGHHRFELFYGTRVRFDGG